MTTKPMTEEKIDSVDGVQLLRSYLLHCRCVRRGIKAVATELVERAECHDDSKLMADEFAGFTRINKAARTTPYLSPEYKAGMAQEQPTIDLHYSRNSHHPEHHGHPLESHACQGMDIAGNMGFLDIIEMVCDWRGAYLAYGSKGTWKENMKRQRERYKDWFGEGQWWLIEQVGKFIEEA